MVSFWSEIVTWHSATSKHPIKAISLDICVATPVVLEGTATGGGALCQCLPQTQPEMTPYYVYQTYQLPERYV